MKARSWFGVVVAVAIGIAAITSGQATAPSDADLLREIASRPVAPPTTEELLTLLADPRLAGGPRRAAEVAAMTDLLRRGNITLVSELLQDRDREIARIAVDAISASDEKIDPRLRDPLLQCLSNHSGFVAGSEYAMVARRFRQRLIAYVGKTFNIPSEGVDADDADDHGSVGQVGWRIGGQELSEEVRAERLKQFHSGTRWLSQLRRDKGWDGQESGSQRWAASLAAGNRPRVAGWLSQRIRQDSY